MKLINPRLWIKSKFVWWGISVVLLVTTTGFYVLKEKEEASRIYTQRQLDKTINEKITITQRLINTIQAKEIIEERLRVEEERSFILAEELEEKERQIELTLDKLEKEIDARRKTEAQLILVMEKNSSLEQELKKFSKAAKAVELERIVVVKPVLQLKGQVLMVNKEYSFVVIDLGRRDDLRLGDILSVYHDNKFIGKVKVEKIEEMVSAAAILSDWQDVEFNEKDEVRKI